MATDFGLSFYLSHLQAKLVHEKSKTLELFAVKSYWFWYAKTGSC
jgi:hypothetical protein